MPDKYSEKEKQLIDLLIRRLWNKAKENGYSYEQIAKAVRAKSRTTVWRWYRKEGTRTYPSQTHIYHIKKFLGYSRA